MTLKDTERSYTIRRDLGMENITLKASQAMLGWHGQIMWMREENKVKQTMNMEVRGRRAKGRPRMRCINNNMHGMNKCGLEEGDAQDRRRWWRMVQNRALHGPEI